MNTTTVKFRSLPYNRVKTYTVAALFVVGNVLLPQLCHLLPQGGVTLLPIYFFTLVAAYRYGWRAGLLTAVASPLVNAALFGMPAAAALPVILVKSVLLAFAAAWAAARWQRCTIALLAAVVIAYQVAGGLFEWGWTGSLAAASQDFRIGLPGMLLQVVGGWFVINRLLKR